MKAPVSGTRVINSSSVTAGTIKAAAANKGAEVWTFDPSTAKWALKEPNTSPPGVCCNQQNVFDPHTGLYLRFPNFSGNHGWQWQRELYLNDASVWTYDLAANRWRNMRPFPAPKLAGLRCASWDSDRQVVVIFGGEGSHEGTLIYDPHRNEWQRPKPKQEPEPRSGGNMAYDARHKLHILFGAQFDDDQHTWAYDVAKNEWRDMQPPTMPPTDKNDAVLTYDPINQVTLAIVKIGSKKNNSDDDSESSTVQTWAYDAGANRWTQLKPDREPDAAGNRTRNLIFAPELNLAILENCTSEPREQQVWTYRYAEAKPDSSELPAKPQRDVARVVDDVVVSVLTKNGVEISWSAPPGNLKPAAYQVERRPSSKSGATISSPGSSKTHRRSPSRPSARFAASANSQRSPPSRFPQPHSSTTRSTSPSRKSSTASRSTIASCTTSISTATAGPTVSPCTPIAFAASTQPESSAVRHPQHSPFPLRPSKFSAAKPTRSAISNGRQIRTSNSPAIASIDSTAATTKNPSRA